MDSDEIAPMRKLTWIHAGRKRTMFFFLVARLIFIPVVFFGLRIGKISAELRYPLKKVPLFDERQVHHYLQMKRDNMFSYTLRELVLPPIRDTRSFHVTKDDRHFTPKMGVKRLGVKRLGRKRLGGETTAFPEDELDHVEEKWLLGDLGFTPNQRLSGFGSRIRTNKVRLALASGGETVVNAFETKELTPQQNQIPFNPNPGHVNITYTERKEKLLKAWEEIRDQMLKTRIEELSPATYTCIMCTSEQDNIIHCEQCGANAYYCDTCCQRIHAPMLFHQPRRWNGTLYIPVILKRSLCRGDHLCDTQYDSVIYVVDNEGQQHECTARFCKCEEPAVTFLRYNLLPATPSSPKVGLDLRFMELLTVLQLECHIPAKTFCNALTFMRTFNFNVVAEGRNIYRALVGDCLAEYSYHRASLITKHTICSQTIGRHCPVCNENPPVVSMDGNFGLVHKASSGDGHGQLSSRQGSLFFPNQDEVQEFMGSYNPQEKTTSNTECSNFQAGNVLRSKVKTKKLDITGVFGSVCKHDIPLMMVDMSHGERLGYPAYILRKLLQNRTENVVITYDIACTLHKHFQKMNCMQILDKCTFAVPVFHSFAHNVSCQLKYGQRFVTGTGLTDGEGIERLWSYLRGFKKITKEMSVNNRQDLLTDALLHHTLKVIDNMAYRWKDKLQKIDRILSENKTLTEGNGYMEDIDRWLEEWKESSECSSKKALALTVEEQFHDCQQKKKYQSNFLELTCDETEKDKLQKEITRLSKQMERLRRKCPPGVNLDDDTIARNAANKKKIVSLKNLKSYATDRQYLSSVMKKYADGQGVGMRVSKQFSINTNKIKHELELLNMYSEERVEFAHVSVPSAPIFQELKSSSVTEHQQKAIEQSYLAQHAEKEKLLISEELKILSENLSEQSNEILSSIEMLKSKTDRHSKGKLVFLHNAHYVLENLIENFFQTGLLTNDETFPFVVHNIFVSEIVNSERGEINSETLDNILESIEEFETEAEDEIIDEEISDDDDEQ